MSLIIWGSCRIFVCGEHEGTRNSVQLKEGGRAIWACVAGGRIWDLTKNKSQTDVLVQGVVLRFAQNKCQSSDSWGHTIPGLSFPLCLKMEALYWQRLPASLFPCLCENRRIQNLFERRWLQAAVSYHVSRSKDFPPPFLPSPPLFKKQNWFLRNAAPPHTTKIWSHKLPLPMRARNN